MARTFHFECARCRYRASVTGGQDRGVHAYVQTVLCRDCRKLYDVPYRMRVANEELETRFRLWRTNLLRQAAGDALRPASLGSFQSRLPYGGASRGRWLRLQLACPVAGFHRVEPWAEPGPCPRCGNPLERAVVMPHRIWE